MATLLIFKQLILLIIKINYNEDLSYINRIITYKSEFIC